MSKKLSGNGLWESSRMMLPEHREIINQNLFEHNRKKRPIIHKDEWDNFFYYLNQSFHEKEIVEVALFDSYINRSVRGVVTQVVPHLKKFKVEMDNGYEWIEFAEIVNVKLV